MSERLVTTGIAILCDAHGLIQTVIYDDIGLAGLAPGKPLRQVLAPDSQLKLLNFLVEVREKGAVFNWDFNLNHQGQTVTLRLTGTIGNDSLIIAGGREPQSDINFCDLCYELLKNNASQANVMRAAFKSQVAANETVYKGNEAVYDEISLLNNELVTLQRDLAKKNAALQRLNAEYQKLAVTDALTEVFNRRGLFEIGGREIERATRYARPLSVITLDFDNFKTINDTYGHAMGDEVLKGVAKCCFENLRKVDFIGRYGGDEFIILLPETGPNEARDMAERLLMLISNLVIDSGPEELHVTVSMGIASLEGKPINFAELLRRSDHALMCAKRAGRNTIFAWDPAV